MQTGTFKGHVIDKIVSPGQSDKPNSEHVVIQIEVEFSPEEKRTMNYYGHLSEKSFEYTLKALVACGITGNSLFDPITPGTEVSVVIDQVKDKEKKLVFNENGSPKLKISWVNKPMSMGTPMDENKGRMALKKFEGALAKMRQSAPLKNYAPQSNNEDDGAPVPF